MAKEIYGLWFDFKIMGIQCTYCKLSSAHKHTTVPYVIKAEPGISETSLDPTYHAKSLDIPFSPFNYNSNPS